MSAPPAAIELSIVCPAHNEQPNLQRLVQEITGALDSKMLDYEIVIVDDGSTDETPALLRHLMNDSHGLRTVRLQPAAYGTGNGQSAALHAGILASRGTLVAMMDADLQNDPADLPRLIDILHQTGADMVQGDRAASRADGFLRRFSSWVGRITRRMLLGDTIRDTGCTLRLMRRQVALALPLQHRGMHRFIPYAARKAGFIVIEVPVSHRPRTAGRTNYGVWNRALPGLVDCFKVRRICRRHQPVQSERLT